MLHHAQLLLRVLLLISKKDWIELPIVSSHVLCIPRNSTRAILDVPKAVGCYGKAIWTSVFSLWVFKAKKTKIEQNECRSDSEGSDDEESHLKRQFPRSFHS